MRFFYLVQEHDRVRVFAHGVGKKASSFRTYYAARHADELVDRDARVLVLAHVYAYHLFIVAEEELGQGFRELGLADPGRAEEKEHAVGPGEVLFQRPLVEPEALGQCVYRLSLPHDPPCEHLLHVLEPADRVPEYHVPGDPGLLGDDLYDIVGFHGLRGPVYLDLDARGVEPAYYLVRHLEAAHVALAHIQGGLDRLVRDLYRVAALKPGFYAVEYLSCLLNGGLLYVYEPEASGERLVLRYEFLVFRKGGRADYLHLAAR